MLHAPTLEHAVDLQRRSYRLLRWMSEAIDRGFISYDAAHTYSTLTAAAEAWIAKHHLDLPGAARPHRDDIPAFARLFSTYLESSFVLVRDPRKRLHSPDAHCFCPMCSWLVAIPHLQTKKLTRRDREGARKLQLAAVQSIAAELSRALPDGAAEELVADPSVREELALTAYGRDLLSRLQGFSAGPATLALWRRFAWTAQGSPRKGFELDAAEILRAEAKVTERIRLASR
jgi:hypothetical protein